MSQKKLCFFRNSAIMEENALLFFLPVDPLNLFFNFFIISSFSPVNLFRSAERTSS